MISEYLTAIHQELLRELSNEQVTIHSTLVEPLAMYQVEDKHIVPVNRKA